MSEWYEIDAAWDSGGYASDMLLKLGETLEWGELVHEVGQNTHATAEEVWDGMAAALRGYLESLDNPVNANIESLIDLLTDDEPMQSEFVNCGNPYREGDVLEALRYYADENRYDYDPLRDVFEVDERLSELCGSAANLLADIERTHMKLPLDADGVPIHTGDLMERCCAEETGAFRAWFFSEDGYAMDEETLFFNPKECRHAKQRTVEEVLSEFADMPERIDRIAAVNRVADEIKEIMLEEAR